MVFVTLGRFHPSHITLAFTACYSYCLTNAQACILAFRNAPGIRTRRGTRTGSASALGEGRRASRSCSGRADRLGKGTQDAVLCAGLCPSGIIIICRFQTTFAKALEENIPLFKRCNQDDLGSRQAVERVARQALRSGLSACIDRTNFDQT